MWCQKIHWAVYKIIKIRNHNNTPIKDELMRKHCIQFESNVQTASVSFTKYQPVKTYKTSEFYFLLVFSFLFFIV